MRRVSLISGLLLTAATGAQSAQSVTILTPTDDRWHYPFNFLAGSRQTGSCFGATGVPFFNDRDGEVVAAWNTAGSIAPGQGVDSYGIRSVRVTLTNEQGATWPVDGTVDEWFTFDVNQDGIVNADGVARGQPGDTDGESSDTDPGRATELFGAGFGPFYTQQTWNENSIYVGSDSQNNVPRDPFPFVYLGNGPDSLHVEDNVDGLFNESFSVFHFTPQPWAVGVPVNYTPGSQPVPFDVAFDVNLSLSGGRVRRYFQEQLNAGKLAVIVTSLRETVVQGSTSDLPSFFMKESAGIPGARSPRLDIVVCQAIAPDFDRDCDVDGDDLAFLAGCRTGPRAGPPAPGCERADLDGDVDVDQDDFGRFQRCYGGSGNDPSPACNP